MRTVILGSSDLTSSRLGFGTSSLHHLPTSMARQRLLNHAWDRGIRHFDTAPLYGHELAERELGKFGQNKRSKVIFATKFGILPIPLLTRFPALIYPRMYGMGLARKLFGQAPAIGRIVRDYSAREAVDRVNRSLKLLRTDYLDIVFLHEPTLALVAAPDDLTETLSELKKLGKVRQFGVSGTGNDCIDLARANPSLATLLQVDVDPASGGLTALKSGELKAGITFGHMRSLKNPPVEPDARIREAIRQATQNNPDGVILYSSRKTGHIDETVAYLESIERC